MGLIVAEVELINGYDLENAERKIIKEEDVRRMKVNMLVDSGAYNLCINEVIQEQLQFTVVEKRKAETADGRIIELDVVKMLKSVLKIGQPLAGLWFFQVIMSHCLEPFLWKIWMC